MVVASVNTTAMDTGKDSTAERGNNNIEIRNTREHPVRELEEDGSTQQLRSCWYQRIRWPSRWEIFEATVIYLFFYSLTFIDVSPLFSRKGEPFVPQHRTPSLRLSAPGSQNPPFGLFVDDNIPWMTWHVYFQATDSTANSRSYSCPGWAHATSTDLYTWTTHSVALEAYDGLGGGLCIGSIVVDRNNTSGLFPDQSNGIIALYTAFQKVSGLLRSCLAYSLDGGYSFIKQEDVMLRGLENVPYLPNVNVVWHVPTQRWIMTTSLNGTSISFYTSRDLLEWKHITDFTISRKPESDFTQDYEPVALSPIPRINTTGARNWTSVPILPGGEIRYEEDYILVVSTSPRTPLNLGSVTRYLPGSFNGTHFLEHSWVKKFLEFGPDNYANHFFSGLPESAPVVSLALAANRGSPSNLFTEQNSSTRSIYTLPREGYLIHGPIEGDMSYFNRPVGLDNLRGETILNLSTPSTVNADLVYNSDRAVLFEAELEMRPLDNEPIELNLNFFFRSSKSSGWAWCVIVFTTWAADFACDRSNAITERPAGPWEPSPLDQMHVSGVRPLLPFHNPAVRRWQVQIILDGSILEVFLNGGVYSGTMRIQSELEVDEVAMRSCEFPAWANLNVVVQKLELERTV